MIFWVHRGVEGPKMVQNDKKFCLLHSISQEPYIIWLSFMVQMWKIIICWCVSILNFCLSLWTAYSSTQHYCIISIFETYLKACVCCFYFYFLPPNLYHQMIALKKLWKVLFISSENFFLFLRYSNFCNFCLSFPNFPDSKEQMEME